MESAIAKLLPQMTNPANDLFISKRNLISEGNFV